MFEMTFCRLCCDYIGDVWKNNTNIVTPEPSKSSFYMKHPEIFWCFCSVCIIIAILTILGNGLVIYVSHVTRSTGRLRYLDNVVYSLAVTDFLFGVIGVPIITSQYYMRKFSRLTYKNIHKHIFSPNPIF